MLTRHEFATVQSHLSTVYFASSAVLASLSLGTFLIRHPLNTWSKEATNLVRILIIISVKCYFSLLLFSIGYGINYCIWCS
jgi:hypothetical protein